MALAGYTFQGPSNVPAGDGDVEWCGRLAKRFDCIVVWGRPRREGDVLYNSLAVVRANGSVALHYDKRHLYDVDKTWAVEGSNDFISTDGLVPGLRIGFGICMDINPYEFERRRSEDFELASFHKKAGTNVLLFSAAWCSNHPDDPLRARAREDAVPNRDRQRSTISSWVSRLEPLVGTDTFFVCADRVGHEALALSGRCGGGKTRFCGSSCVLALKDLEILGALDSVSEGVLVVDIPPKSINDA
mmetsp:Transcript_23879/g.81669  ORF Transcript_23879/g.81669 Transcript_23879/m.81669 type:complete len:245 (-) Transcript_23879:17-751(-)